VKSYYASIDHLMLPDQLALHIKGNSLILRPLHGHILVLARRGSLRDGTDLAVVATAKNSGHHRSGRTASAGGDVPKPEPARLAFVFGMALTTLAIIMWLSRDLAVPIPPTEPIYQPQHLNLYQQRQ
jgi:hypothetical protein